MGHVDGVKETKHLDEVDRTLRRLGFDFLGRRRVFTFDAAYFSQVLGIILLFFKASQSTSPDFTFSWP